MSSVKLSRRKMVLFSIVPALLMLVLLVAAEILIRVLHPEDDLALVRETAYDGIPWYETNRSALRIYFPAGTPSIPEFKTALFRRQKAPGALRIFCLGESTMFGTPYDMNANIPGIVRKQLRRLFPNREVEVINWGASAINSNVVRDLAPAMLPFHPDAVLVYLGHNELYGPDGIGASWLERQWPVLTRLKYSVRKLRLYRAVSAMLPASAPSREEAANLMKEVSGGHLIRPGSGDAARVFTNFEGNLRAIIATFTSAGVPVVISEVTSNLMMPPFVSGPAEEADSTLRRLFRSGDDTAALDIYRTLAGDDTAHAGIHYWAGRAMLRKGNTNGAFHALLRAKDEDLLKFRAPAEINRVIRRVARETGIPCVAADSIFRAESPGAVPGDELFWEHLHPTLQGYYLLANGFVRTAGAALGLPSLLPVLVPPDPDSLSVAWLELAYADLSIRHLTGRWPFKDYHRAPAVIADADPVPLSIVQGVYDRRTTWGDGCYQSATYFWSKGDLRRARTTFEAMLEDYPFSFYTNYLMGSLINTAGDRTGSLPYYRRAIASNPGYSPARLELGLLLVNLGDYDAAISLLEGLAAETGPSTDPVTAATAYYGLGASYANKGDLAKALRMLDRALVIAPDYKSAEQLRAQIRAARQQ